MSWFQAAWLGSEGARAGSDAGGLGKTWQSPRPDGRAALRAADGTAPTEAERPLASPVRTTMQVTSAIPIPTGRMARRARCARWLCRITDCQARRQRALARAPAGDLSP